MGNSIRTSDGQTASGTTGGKSTEIPDIVEFTRWRLQPKSAATVRVAGRAAWHRQLHAAVGQIDGGSGEGCVSRVLPAGQPDTGADRRAPGKSAEFMRKGEEFVSRLGIKVRG